MASFFDPFGIDRFFRSRLNEFFGPFGDELDFSVAPRQAIEPDHPTSAASSSLMSGNGGGSGGALSTRGNNGRQLAHSNASPFSLMSNWQRVRLDMVERPDSYVATVEIPGIPKENIKIYIEGNVLSIEGEKKMEHRQEEDQVFLTERSYGKFQRSLRMPDNCNLDDCKTSFDNGVLRLTFGKKEPTNRKTITVE